jgi:hypothetical protein
LLVSEFNKRATMFIKRGYDKVLIPVLAAGILVYASIRPTFRLRAEMPRQFIDEYGSLPAQGRASEEKIARAYWTCVVTEIQWKYVYGYRLPQDPPPEFTANAAADPATRARYWRKLQEVWYQPSTWTKGYEWDFNWLTDWVRSASQWLHQHLPSLGNGS